MSTIKDDKQSIFNKISALKTLNDDLPKLKSINSISSINDSGDEISFLIDLFKVTGTYNKLIDTINSVIVSELSSIESAIKLELKNNIKSTISCSINPTIPNELITDGLIIPVSTIDYEKLMLIDPDSSNGNLLYDTPYTLKSKDFNTFLYYTIQSEAEQTWGNNTIGKEIIDIKFYETGFSDNNVLKININNSYSGKTIINFNNDFIDSITLFNTKNIISKVFDNITGSISSTSNKTATQIAAEEQINAIIANVLNSIDDVIDDSYFTFSNDDLASQEANSFNRSQGIVTLSQENENNVNINYGVFNSSLTGITSTLVSGSTYIQKTAAIESAINNIANELTKTNSSSSNAQSVKVNLIENIIRNLTTVLSTTILSPKVIILYYINAILMNENPPTDQTSFIKQHKNLIFNTSKAIKNKIVNIMVSQITKTIKQLVNEEIKAIIQEQINNRKLLLKSLI